MDSATSQNDIITIKSPIVYPLLIQLSSIAQVVLTPLNVSQECLDIGLRASAVVLHDLQIGDAPSELRSRIDLQARKARDQYASPAEIRSIPELVDHHEILRRVGVKPRSHPPSTQKLLEYAWKRGTLPSVNNLVDTYNLISLRSRCSVGAHDLDRIGIPVELRLFRGDESFRPLGSNEDQQVRPGEFGYVDAQRQVICRLDSMQADFSKIQPNTTHALLIVETTAGQSSEQLQRVLAGAAEAVDRFCRGRSE